MSTVELLELTAEQLNDEYLTVAFSNGFSKGTANVTPHDMRKLRPLLDYYAKKPHPFTACVRDNRKRFGPRTEAICAVVKDLIFHSTKWRQGRKGGKAHLSADFVEECILHDLPDEFLEWIHEIEESDMEEWARLSQGDNDEDEEEAVELSEDTLLAEMFFADGEDAGDVDGELVWKTILRVGDWAMSPTPGTQEPQRKAIKVVKSGKSDPSNMVISMSELMRNFKAGAVEHVQIPVGHNATVLQNTGFAKDLRIRKNAEGIDELQAAIDFTEPEVKEKAERGTIANTSAGILWNFVRKGDGKKFGAVLDHIALTNRPWLDGLKPFGAALEDGDFESALFSMDDSAVEETDLADVLSLRNAADSLRRAIASYQGDDVTKLEGALSTVLDSLAYCEKEQGSKPVAYSEDKENDGTGGGEDMPNEDTEVKEDTFLQKIGLSEDEANARLGRYEELERENKLARIDKQVGEWETAKKAPAVIKEARKFLLADEGAVALNLSQDGTSRVQPFTASEIVEALVKASPSLDLATDKVTEREQTPEDGPEKDAERENEEAQLSQEVRALATSLFFDGEARSEEAAIAMAKKRLGETETAKA